MATNYGESIFAGIDIAGIKKSLLGPSPVFRWMSRGELECIYPKKGPDMSKFTEWLMEMYPKTEDYVYIDGVISSSNAGYRYHYLRIKPDPQAFLDQMRDFDEMMED